MGIIGCYCLHLYCDHKDCFGKYDGSNVEFTGHTFMECKKEAKECGWVFKHQKNTKDDSMGYGIVFCSKHRDAKMSEARDSRKTI